MIIVTVLIGTVLDALHILTNLILIKPFELVFFPLLRYIRHQVIKSPIEGYRQFIGKQYIRYVSSLPRDCQVILHMVCVKKNKQASEQYVYNDTICCKRGTICLGLFLEG